MGDLSPIAGTPRQDICATCQNVYLGMRQGETVHYEMIDWSCSMCTIILRLLPRDIFSNLSTSKRSNEEHQLNASIVLKCQGNSVFEIWDGLAFRGEIEFLVKNPFANVVINGHILFEGGEAAYAKLNEQEEQEEVHPRYRFPLENASRSTSETLRYPDIREWVNECVDTHLCGSYAPRGQDAPVKTFFIDTLNRCLVRNTSDLRFVALSYVRGKEEMIEMTRASATAFQEPGALANIMSQLSPVVQDAIEFTVNLGERYLWVDTLCIPQDEHPHKAKMIMEMDKIYTHAVLAVIALNAKAASSPLPGVRRETRCQGLVLNRSLGREQKQCLAVRPSLTALTETAMYSTRGWTFQEAILPTRCLIFTDYQVFFHCSAMLRSDGTIFPFGDSWSERQALTSTFQFTHDDSSRFVVYTELIELFSLRHLSYHTDSLNAISGVLAVLSEAFGWRFLAGLPENAFHHALLWRQLYTTLNSHKPLRNHNFPSWSWAGWHGGIVWNFGSLLDTHSSMQSRAHLWAPLRSEIKLIKSKADAADISSAVDMYIKEPTRYGVLRFAAFTAPARAFKLLHHGGIESFSVGQKRKDRPLYPYKEIWWNQQIRCGILYDCSDDLIPIKDSSFKFVAVSRLQWPSKQILPSNQETLNDPYEARYGRLYDANRLPFSEWCFVNVMLIERKDHKSERQAVGLIHEDIWKIVAPDQEDIELY